MQNELDTMRDLSARLGEGFSIRTTPARREEPRRHRLDVLVIALCCLLCAEGLLL